MVESTTRSEQSQQTIHSRGEAAIGAYSRMTVRTKIGHEPFLLTHDP